MPKILIIVGTRPNFIKAAPLLRAFKQYPHLQTCLVHTGQHGDEAMSTVFFNQLELPQPAYALGVKGSTVSELTARIILSLGDVFIREKPDLVLVIGDVTSTLASALVAAQHHIPIAHVEAGLRSGDRAMPEELNRTLTDQVADYLFVTEQAGLVNLHREDIADARIHFVGNVLIDTLLQYRQLATQRNPLAELALLPKQYALLTMHRPVNVDTPDALHRLVAMIQAVAAQLTVVLPLHPRTKRNLEQFDRISQLHSLPNVHIVPPQDYLNFLNLMDNAACVITDSGGVQEETTCLNVPCLTLRNNTERPVTIEMGTNHLMPNWTPDHVAKWINQIRVDNPRLSDLPPLWDGQAANRVAEVLNNVL